MCVVEHCNSVKVQAAAMVHIRRQMILRIHSHIFVHLLHFSRPVMHLSSVILVLAMFLIAFAVNYAEAHSASHHYG